MEGLHDNRFALIFKTHHALVDGVSGVDLATVLFDLQSTPTAPPADLEAWRPKPEPSRGRAGSRRRPRNARRRRGARRPRGASRLAAGHALSVLRDAAEGVGEIVWAGLNPAPETPLNVEIGPHRRYSVVRQQLRDYKTVKDALGGTVNDVVLSVVSGALARWLRSRGIRTEGLEMRALVPVSVRTEEHRGTLGNKLAAMRAPLPVYIDDPVARLRFVRRAMDGLKESKQAVGAETLARVNNLAPPTILAQASRLNFSTRLFNLIVTNIPGPQVPLYVLGRKLEELFPVAFLPNNHGLAIAIMSYNGGIGYGLLADYDALPDVDVIAEGLDASLVSSSTQRRGSRRRAQDAPPPGRPGSGRAAGGPDPPPRAPARQSGAGRERESGRTVVRRRSSLSALPAAPRADRPPTCAPNATVRPVPLGRTAATDPMAGDLIQPGETAYRLELTAAQLKIVHTALKSLFDDLGHDEHDVKHVVASVLDKLPGEHEIRAIDLGHELRGTTGG